MEKLACFTVVKPQGIKGELKARILADGIYSVQGIKKLYTEDGNEYGVVKIKDAFSGFAFITLQSIATRNDAELLRGVTFYAPKNSIKKAKDEYFITDIIDSEKSCMEIAQDLLQYPIGKAFESLSKVIEG